MANPLFTKTNRFNNPIEVGDMKLLPIVQSFEMNMPGYRGTLTYSRPKEVVIQLESGETYSIDIIDQTRQQQIIILCIGLFTSIITWLFFRASK